MTSMRFSKLRLLVLLAMWPACAPALVTFNVNETADRPDDIHDGVCADAFGKCTLRAAIMEANLGGTFQVDIVLPAGTYTLTRGVTNPDDHSNGDLDVTGVHDVRILGAGASKTIVDANHVDRAFWISETAKLQLYDVTIRNGQPSSLGGRSTDGGAVLVHGELFASGCVLDSNTASSGGALAASPGNSNTPSVTTLKTTLSRNVASLDGGAYYGYQTDAFFNASTLASNIAHNGGGLRQQTGQLDMQNSTLFLNDAAGFGGGMYLSDTTVNLYNVTVAGNGVDSDLDNIGSGGGFYAAAATMTVSNSVFANLNDNTHANDDCHTSATTVAFSGGNILRSVSGCSYSGFVYEQDPLLGPLKDNGGPTRTAMPSPSSLAVDQGGFGCPGSSGGILAEDQRGVKRPIGSKCDLGAAELEPVGDVNGDGLVNVSDVFYLVNFLFAGGTAPLGRANVNGDSAVSVTDVFYLINFLFAGGAAPI